MVRYNNIVRINQKSHDILQKKCLKSRFFKMHFEILTGKRKEGISEDKSAKIIINMQLLFAFYGELKFVFMCGTIDDGMENCR